MADMAYSMTPQFSVFVAYLIERGCLFALPNIRGGAEFGAEWHEAAKRRNRQTAYDDFPRRRNGSSKLDGPLQTRLAIFGGSNSGLLVGAALTQRPELFPRGRLHGADARHAAESLSTKRAFVESGFGHCTRPRGKAPAAGFSAAPTSNRNSSHRRSLAWFAEVRPVWMSIPRREEIVVGGLAVAALGGFVPLRSELRPAPDVR